MTPIQMTCPVCRREVIPFKERRLETLDEHVTNAPASMKLAYHCEDEVCPSRINGIFWNDHGELYTEDFIPREKMELIPFVSDNNAPFGTFQRQMNVEIYKKDENRQLCILPIWFPNVLSGMKIRTRWVYQSNEDGDILKRRCKFDYIRKDGIMHMWGIHMLKYCIGNIFRSWQGIRKNPLNSNWHRKQLQTHMCRENIALHKNPLNSNWHRKQLQTHMCRENKEWWRKVSSKVAAFALKHSPDSPDSSDGLTSLSEEFDKTRP